MGKEFLQVVSRLADQQKAAEARKEKYIKKAEELKEEAKVALDQGDFVKVQQILNQIQDVEATLEEIHEQEYRTCRYCGRPLKPHSLNWFEGACIEGCDFYRDDGGLY